MSTSMREALERCDHTLTAHGHIDANTPLHDTIRAALASHVEQEPVADRETLQTLLDLLNPLHGSLDRQMYVDKPNPDFDPQPDDESDVIVTAKMERDLTQAVSIIESRLKDGTAHPAPSAEAIARALVDDIRARMKKTPIKDIDRADRCAMIELLHKLTASPAQDRKDV